MQMDGGHTDNEEKESQKVSACYGEMVTRCIHSSVQFNKVIRLYKNK